MFGIGANELILILLFGFLIFGPDKLPAMAKTIGKAIAKFRNAQNEMNQVVKNEIFDPTAEDPFKNPLDAAAKLEKAAKKEDKQESFTERKARYDKQRAAKKRAEERKAELAGEPLREDFVYVTADLNGLKNANDTLGHAAGDRYICDACRIICNTFKHSPVYRIGGDEFVAILSGSDYEEREALLRDFGTQNDERRKAGKIVIACGLADYNPDSDKDFSSVFERADAAMYEDKARLKDGLADPERA